MGFADCYFPASDFAFFTSSTNSARYPPGSCFFAASANSSTSAKFDFPLYGESRSSMANDATAAANWKSSRRLRVAAVTFRHRQFAERARVAVRLLVPHLHDERLVRLVALRGRLRRRVLLVPQAVDLAAAGSAAPTGTSSYRAVTLCPAPISPASFLSSLKSLAASMRFS